MSTVSVTLPSDGTTADVSDYNTPITTIVNAINGNLDSSNISSLSGTKITAGTLPGSAFDAATSGGYIGGLAAPTSVTYNGNRSYTMVFNGVDLTGTLSPGMRMRTTRTVPAPTQCTSLNGSTQYYNKTSPAGMTFTDDFVISAWVKITSYGVNGTIESRYNGTSGLQLYIDTTGNIHLQGFNGSSSNFSEVKSYQSIPLNKWVHIAAQLDMSSFTASPTTSYVMIDGSDVQAVVSRGGTNPTALVQAGNLEIGSTNGGTLPFPGKIAQAAIFNAKVTQTTIQSYYSQGLAGTETSLISAYSFSNSINDLNTSNTNNLTANGSAVATNADSPFGGQAGNTISSTLDYCEILITSFSTNTTLTVRVPDVNTIPTSGGVSAIVYSSSRSPYGFPGISRILGSVIWATNQTNTATGPGVFVTGGVITAVVPSGGFPIKLKAYCAVLSAGAGAPSVQILAGSSIVAQSNVSSGTTCNVESQPLWLPAGSTTFNLNMYESSAGTLTWGASTSQMAWFTVELANE